MTDAPGSDPPSQRHGTDQPIPAPRRLRDAGTALRYRDYRLFWTGALISNTGAWMQRVTVPFVIFELTHSTTWVGFAAFMQFIPVVVMGPVGGSVADRHRRRSVLLVTQSLMAVLALVLWALWIAGLADRWTLIAVVTLVGANFGINGPAWQAFVSELVPRRVLLNAVTLNSTQFNAARAVGPALAGIVIALAGPGWVFLINAVSFVAVIVALVLIEARPARTGHATRPKPYREFADALRYAGHFPGIVAAFVLVTALGFLGGPIVQLLPVFAEDVFGVGDTAYGFLGAALGVGAVLGSPLVAGRGSGMPRSRLVVMAVVAYGASLVAFGLAPVYGAGVLALLVAGAGYLAIASTLNTTIQVQVDEAFRGKVLAAYLMFLTLAMPVGALVQGWLADVVGPRRTVAGAGALFAALGLVLASRPRWVSGMDDEGHDPATSRPA